MFGSLPFGRQRPRLVYAGLGVEPRGWEGAHSHDFTELYFLGAGAGKLLADRDTYPLRRGDLVVLNRDALHDTYIDGPDPAYYYLGVNNLKVTEGNILKNKRFCIIPTGAQYEAVGGTFKQLAHEYGQPLSFAEPITDRLLQLVLLYVLRLAESDLNLSYGKSSVYAEAKEYFDANFTQIESLEYVCQLLNVNKFYLTHIFKEQTGIPPVKYLTNKRMELAEKLLSSTDLDIGEIANRCGYADTPYFCRVFKRHADRTPLQYRYASRSKR